MYEINLSALETELKAYLSACLNLDIDDGLSGFYEVTYNDKLVIYRIELNAPAPETLDYSDICTEIAIDAFIYDDTGRDLELMYYFDVDCLNINNQGHELLLRLEYNHTR